MKPSLFALSLVFALFIGCAKAPNTELDAAQAALTAADEAEADVYVADLYTAAQDSFNAAQTAIEAENFEHATALLQFTQMTATDAQAQVEPRKDAMRQENEDLIAQAEMLLAQLGTANPVATNDATTAPQSTLNEAKAAQVNGDVATANQLAKTAVEQATTLVSAQPETIPAPRS